MKKILFGGVLYDKAYPDFKNKYARAAVWEEKVAGLDSVGSIPYLYLIVLCLDLIIIQILNINYTSYPYIYVT